MLYHLFKYLAENYDFVGENLYKFLTFRAGLAIIISLIISMVFGGKIIDFIRKQQVGETVRDLGLAGQKEKEGTPTMGGIIIIMAILVPLILLADLTNVYVQLMLVSTVWMGIIGFTDDYIKVFKKDKEGLSGRFKILGQVGLGLIIGITMLMSSDVRVRMNSELAENYGLQIDSTKIVEVRGGLEEFAYLRTTITNVPFFKGNEADYSKVLFFLEKKQADKWVWIIFIPLVVFLVTAVSNGANLTDGLDGLATGVSAIIGATLGLLAYVSGNAIAAEYLNILFIPESGELVVFSACFLGACIGFLWYNSYPAQVFMGDTGSLTLGGIIAAFSILIRKEFLLPILCGVFLIETLSVIIQVSYFKYTKRKHGEGKRIFLMSPLHHHYQKKGMHEAKIVNRFWIIGILLAVLTVITLKIR